MLLKICWCFFPAGHGFCTWGEGGGGSPEYKGLASAATVKSSPTPDGRIASASAASQRPPFGTPDDVLAKVAPNAMRWRIIDAAAERDSRNGTGAPRGMRRHQADRNGTRAAGGIKAAAATADVSPVAGLMAIEKPSTEYEYEPGNCTCYLGWTGELCQTSEYVCVTAARGVGGEGHVCVGGTVICNRLRYRQGGAYN
jgi:hypothetical protein